MSYRLQQDQLRQKLEATYDDVEVAKYDKWIQELTDEDHDACLQDILKYLTITPQHNILDAGAGTGAMCQVLSRIPGVKITALEPLGSMLRQLKQKPLLSHVRTVQGFCDHDQDRSHFESGEFDVIFARQLINGLYDPLAAFRNWRYWLKPSGYLVVIDGMFDRVSWTGVWSEWVDQLPMSCIRSIATVPYLLEVAEFQIIQADFMEKTNSRSSTITKRIMVIAQPRTCNKGDH